MDEKLFITMDAETYKKWKDVDNDLEVSVSNKEKFKYILNKYCEFVKPKDI